MGKNAFNMSDSSYVASLVDTSTATPNEKQKLLFDVDCPLNISIDDFNENWWPLVLNIWTQWNSYKQANGDVWKVFACHFTKHRESSTRQKENIPNEKC